MDESFLVTQFLTQLLPQLPLYLVWIVGAILAIITWGRNPLASLLTVLAVLIFFLGSCGGTLASTFVLGRMYDLHAEARASIFSFIALLRALIAAVAYGLLFAAVFVGRKRQTAHASPEWDRPREE